MTITHPGLIRFTQEVAHGKTAQTIRCVTELDGALVTATSATVSIFKPGSETATISAASATISGNEASYSLDASTTATWFLGEDYRAEFSLVVSTVTYVRPVSFDVVRTPLVRFPPCSVEELKTGSYANESLLSNTSQTDAAQRYIHVAWQELIAWLKSKGRRVSLLSAPEALAQPLRWRALELLYRASSSSPGDHYERMANNCAEEYADARQNVTLNYKEGDGIGGETARGIAQPKLLIGPDHSTSYSGRLFWVRQ